MFDLSEYSAKSKYYGDTWWCKEINLLVKWKMKPGVLLLKNLLDWSKRYCDFGGW